jgi:hypothetical protein
LWSPHSAPCAEEIRSPAAEDWSFQLSSRWTWQSTKPGRTVRFERSITVAPTGTPADMLPMLTMRPFSITSTAFGVTLPVRTSSSLPALTARRGLCAWAAVAAVAAARVRIRTIRNLFIRGLRWRA